MFYLMPRELLASHGTLGTSQPLVVTDCSCCTAADCDWIRSGVDFCLQAQQWLKLRRHR